MATPGCPVRNSRVKLTNNLPIINTESLDVSGGGHDKIGTIWQRLLDTGAERLVGADCLWRRLPEKTRGVDTSEEEVTYRVDVIDGGSANVCLCDSGSGRAGEQ